MMIDKELAKEIKAANGDGSREAKFALLRRIDKAAKDMSRPGIREEFDDMIKKHGRAVVAICVAASIWSRRDRLDWWQTGWAQDVLDCWTTKPAGRIERATINDGLHPTRICEYAGDFIRLTTE